MERGFVDERDLSMIVILSEDARFARPSRRTPTRVDDAIAAERLSGSRIRSAVGATQNSPALQCG